MELTTRLKQALIPALRGRAEPTIMGPGRHLSCQRYHEAGARTMRIESSGHSRGNPRLYELVEHAPKTGKSPTVWAWPELMDYLKVAGQPVAGPWPPHQEPRPDPEEDTLPVAVADPQAPPLDRPGSPRQAGAD
jgi:hypothetical protein